MVKTELAHESTDIILQFNQHTVEILDITHNHAAIVVTYFFKGTYS
jgi:hypothetical protein